MDLFTGLGTVTASEIFDDGFVCLYKFRQMSGVNKQVIRCIHNGMASTKKKKINEQGPSLENLTKPVDLWDNSSITITYIDYHESRRGYEQKKKNVLGKTCASFSLKLLFLTFLWRRG